VVEAATLHRYCGQGVVVGWLSGANDHSKPAQSLRLWAGSSRLRAAKQIVRFAQDDKSFAQDDKSFAQGDKSCTQGRDPFPLNPQAIPGPQVSQVKKRKRTL